MKTLNIVTQNSSVVQIEYEPSEDNEFSKYYISPAVTNGAEVAGKFGIVKFQKGPIKEFGVNGCQQKDLLAIVLHRLQGFQSSNYACRENALAITKIEEAMHWLNHRTAERRARGVQGTSKI
jgi:hypothetical protein